MFEWQFVGQHRFSWIVRRRTQFLSQVTLQNKERKCFEYIASQFSQLSDAELREGIFHRPQI